MSRTKSTLALALALAFTGCRQAAPMPQPPQAVQTQRAQSDPAGRGGSLRFSAVVVPDAEVPVAFRIPGYVTDLSRIRGENQSLRDLAEGDRVRKGAVLARIRATEYEHKVGQARSQAAAAEAVARKATLDLERATRLYASQSLTRPDYDAARAQFDATQGQLSAARALTAEAEVALRDTTVVSPFDGDIVVKSVERGAFVSPGVPVFVVARTEVVKIVIGVPDTALSSIRLGQPVDVTVDAFADRAFRAHISRIASAADTRTRNFEVEIAIQNPDRALKVGMIGSLDLPATANHAASKPSVRVPLSAVVHAKSGTYGVFLAAPSSGGRVARLRPIEIGPVVGTDIVVLRGLNGGDEVITSGANLLEDGQRVEVLR